MAVVQQPTGTFDEADINNSSSTKSHLKIMIMNIGSKSVVTNHQKEVNMRFMMLSRTHMPH